MSAHLRPLIIKVDATIRRRRTERITTQLSKAGFQVINATTIHDGIRLGTRAHPSLVITVDTPRNGLSAEQWLDAQHTSSTPNFAMAPLIILADNDRLQELSIHALPDRVQILPKTISITSLLDEIHATLSRWSF